MSISELESKGFVAAPEDIREIAQTALAASAQNGETRATYLKALVATIQAELGMPQTKRRSVPAEMDESETRKQMEAMERVHERFYKEVMAVVSSIPPRDEEQGVDRSVLYANRATFARTAKSTLRSWLASGHNIKGLVASKVTKYALAAEVTRKQAQVRAPSEKFLIKATGKLLERVKAIPNKEHAIRLVEILIDQMVKGLVEMGVQTTSKLEDAMRDHKLLETQTGVVWAARTNPEEMVT